MLLSSSFLLFCTLLGCYAAVEISPLNPVVKKGEEVILLCESDSPLSAKEDCAWTHNGVVVRMKASSGHERYGNLALGQCGVKFIATVANQGRWVCTVFEDDETSTSDTNVTLSVTGCGQHPVLQQRLTNRIVGGVPTAEKEVPWIASIQLKGAHICGGSLIRSQYILTAAHCVASRSPKDIKVILGEWNTTAVDNRHRKKLSVDNILVHAFYRPSSTKFALNDIAIIKMENTVELNERISPICLEQRSTISETTATVSGWGKLLFHSNKISEILMKVDLPLYSNDNCTEIFGKKNSIKGTHICAGNLKGGQDSCQGDSGGPLYLSDSSGNGEPKWTLIGIVSGGYECAKEGVLGVYTRVSEFIEWIEENIGEPDDEEPVTFKLPADINTPETSTQLQNDSDENIVTVSVPVEIAFPIQATTTASVTPTLAVFEQAEVSGCGQHPVPQQIFASRNVGGVPTDKKEMPWIASIQRYGVHKCDGSLILPQYILTAANCVTDISPKDITVVLGEWNRTAFSHHREELLVDKIFVHHLYESNVSGDRIVMSINDVALIKTSNTVKLYERIWPICLHLGRSVSEKSATFSGWRKFLLDQSNTTDILNKIDLPLYTESGCNEIFGETQKMHICAGAVSGGEEICQGESGGPLFISDSSRNGAPKWTLIGVSAGYGCASEGKLGLYTRVSEFIEWIKQKIDESSESVEDGISRPNRLG